MTIVSNGFWSYDLADEVGPPTQIFVTRRLPVAANRPVIHVADASRQTIGRLSGEIGSVVWRIDSHGTVTLRLPPEEAELKSHLLTAGNYVKLEFANGLPAWGGVIDWPRELPRDATVINLYSAEYMLGWDVAGEWAQYVADGIYGRVPHEIVGDVLDKIDIRRRGVETTGGVWGKAVETITVDGRWATIQSIFDAVRTEEPAYHWYFEVMGFPVASSVRFVLRQFYDYRRDRRNDVLLIEGSNFVNVEVIHQGPVYNYVIAAAGNYDPDEPTRRRYIARYGAPPSDQRRTLFLSVPDIIGGEEAVTVTTKRLAQRARAEYERLSTPRTRLRGYALNMAPAAFGSYGLGDLINVVLKRQSTTTVFVPSIIMAMEFDPVRGLMSLVTESLTDESEERARRIR